MERWLHAFLLTQAVEMPLYAASLAGRPMASRLALAFGASLLTHPIVWFVTPALIVRPYVAMVVVAELFAILAEAGYLRSLGVPRALSWSAAANLASVSTGFVVRALIGWP